MNVRDFFGERPSNKEQWVTFSDRRFKIFDSFSDFGMAEVKHSNLRYIIWSPLSNFRTVEARYFKFDKRIINYPQRGQSHVTIF